MEYKICGLKKTTVNGGTVYAVGHQITANSVPYVIGETPGQTLQKLGENYATQGRAWRRRIPVGDLSAVTVALKNEWGASFFMAWEFMDGTAEILFARTLGTKKGDVNPPSFGGTGS